MQFAVGGHGPTSEVLFVVFARSRSVSLLADACNVVALVDLVAVVVMGGRILTIRALVV